MLYSLMHRSLLVVLAVGSHAEFDACGRPAGSWLGIDQGLGKSEAKAVAVANSNVYVSFHSHGVAHFAAKYADGTTFGETENHTNTGVDGLNHAGTHDTQTFGENGPSALDKYVHGVEGIVAKIGTGTAPTVFDFYSMESGPVVAGDFEQEPQIKFGASAATADGMLYSTGYFKGNLSAPIKGSPTPTVLSTYSSGKNGEGFVVKIDTFDMSGSWVVLPNRIGCAEGDKDCEKCEMRRIATDSEGAVYVTMEAGKKEHFDGTLMKLASATGEVEWKHTYPALAKGKGDGMMGLATIGTDIYLGGWVQHKDGEDTFGSGALTVPAERQGEITGFLSKYNKLGEIQSTTLIGESVMNLKVVGSSIYAIGHNSIAGGDGPCALTGEYGGFLAKFDAEGVCQWAKDTAQLNYIEADASFIYAVGDTKELKSFDLSADVTLQPNGDEDDILIVKFQLSDGAGVWGVTRGGTGDERVEGIAMNGANLVLVGRTASDQLDNGDLRLKNLQHHAAEAGKDTRPLNSGEKTMFVMELGADVVPSCLTVGSGADECTDAADSSKGKTIASGKCYIDGVCHANDAPNPSQPCFKCEASVDQTKWPAEFDSANYCFIDGNCRSEGDRAPAFSKYNQASVCEACQPSIKADGYSLVAGHFHDRDFALAETERCSKGCKGDYNQISAYGIVFEMQSNGCQVMPDMVPTVTLTVDASAPTLSAGQMVAKAIKAVSEATSTNEGVEQAWVHYHGDSSSCTKTMLGGQHEMCENTPSASADATAMAFETVLYYGQAMARVKVQQGLVILKAELNNGALGATALADLKQDIVAHMLVTTYQSAIHAAYQMGLGGADVAAAQATAADAWSLIQDNWAGSQDDKGRLASLFDVQTPPTGQHYCTASVLLTRNLPASSSNHYGSADSDGARSAGSLDMTFGVVAKGKDHVETVAGGLGMEVHTPKDEDLNPGRTYLSAADLGVLKATYNAEGEKQACTMPPPSPPPPSPSSPPPAEAIDLQQSNSGLSEGELAGVAVGAAVGGIVLLGLVGLVLRSLLFKEAKPVFTCLEKATPNEKK